MIYPLDVRNTKKQKKNTHTKTKTADFFVNTRILVNFFKKSQNNNINFYEKF